MEVKQIAPLVNEATTAILGETGIVNEDLSNLVDVGKAVFNSSGVDNYVRKLVDHIGKVTFVNRPYNGPVPSVYMSAWEYGAVEEKIRTELPEATENESWQLTDGETYNQDVFTAPKVSAKFFSKKTTFEIPASFPEYQVKGSFSNAGQMNAFLSMLEGGIYRSRDIKMGALVMRTINNMIAETLYSEYGTESYGSKSTTKAVNLLYLYNTKYGDNLTAEQAITNPAFIRFASFTISIYITRMAVASTLFNMGATDKFTPSDLLHVVMLTDFKKASDIYLQSDVYHDDLTRMPKAEEIPYWQGSGEDYSFADISGINVKTAQGHTVEASGILAVLFDRDTLGVTNLDRRVTSHYNAKAEFFNNWHKIDAGYFNDGDENFVVFFVAEKPTTPAT